MSSMRGAKVAILESRMSSELARLIARHGGEPMCVPALRETPVIDEDSVRQLISGVQAGRLQFVVLLTGVAVTALFDQAESIGQRSQLIAALKSVTTIARGPKPQAALRGFGVTATVTAKEPFTTAELFDALGELELERRGVALLHYGERNGTLAETLRARDALVEEIWLYRWELPEDTTRLAELVLDLVAARVDVLAITCQIQVRHLFMIAEQLGKAEALVDALDHRVVVASVGPTCTAVLEGYGVHPHVTPEHPKMGPMVAALARWLDRRAEARATA